MNVHQAQQLQDQLPLGISALVAIKDTPSCYIPTFDYKDPPSTGLCSTSNRLTVDESHSSSDYEGRVTSYTHKNCKAIVLV